MYMKKINKDTKIAIDVSQMCYEGTGVARYVFELCQALLRLETPYHFVFYAGAWQNRAYFQRIKRTKPFTRATWQIAPLPPRLANWVFNSTPLPLELFTGSFELLHASDWTHPTTFVPSVTTVHDLVFKKYPSTLDPLIISTQTKRLKKVLNSSSVIIADSHSTKTDLEVIYNIDSSLINVVYPGISALYAPQSKQEIHRVKTKYKLPDQFVFSLGTQEPRKNLARLREACTHLQLPLFLTGKYGWGGDQAVQDPLITSLGYVPDSDLPGLYSASSVFVYPSLYEGFGFPVLEAMACGTPTVTSNLSSMPEIAGQASVLVNPQDTASIEQGILTALESAKTLIPLGIKRAQEFTWEKTAKQVLEVYEKTLNRT